MSLGQIALGSAVTALFHPTGYSKVLIQLGHEPIEPVLGKSFLGFGKKDVWYLPNVFKYSRKGKLCKMCWGGGKSTLPCGLFGGLKEIYNQDESTWPRLKAFYENRSSRWQPDFPSVLMLPRSSDTSV
ncbi:MTCH1-like protein [Mya arenaria]|uniref:MTCH1-like protein n=1 Tax=Mya arenaria TaxID=6604 RepID=A0ABY7EDD5_MYAAR|nr:MTCH1-like protein [Mya arenaria]